MINDLFSIMPFWSVSKSNLLPTVPLKLTACVWYQSSELYWNLSSYKHFSYFYWLIYIIAFTNQIFSNPEHKCCWLALLVAVKCPNIHKTRYNIITVHHFVKVSFKIGSLPIRKQDSTIPIHRSLIFCPLCSVSITGLLTDLKWLVRNWISWCV